MTTARISYRHARTTAKPHYVSRADVARVAAALRRQLGYRDHHARIDYREIAGRISRLEVNGIDVAVDWDLEGTVEDETGAPALGSCEYDLAVPGHALIYVNRQEIGERSYLGRSTVLHELGHAVFDAPAWVLANRQGRLDLGDKSRGSRAFRLVTPGPEHLGNSRTADGPMDWAEFRANEFMGAFLAPPTALRRTLRRLCQRFEVPLVEETSRSGRARIKADFTGRHVCKLETAVFELAEDFGLSPAFIAVRLRKYGLVRGQGL